METCSEKHQFVPILLYIPVPHNGYLEFFERYSKMAGELWLVGADLASDFSLFHKEIRAISPDKLRLMINALGFFREIRVLTRDNVANMTATKIISSSEHISQEVLAKYFPNAEVICDTVFLRYDENSVKSFQSVNYDGKSTDEFDTHMMDLAVHEAEKSPDWWRHVGAVLVKEREIVSIAYNQPVPSEHMPYVFGNPRDFIEAGKLSHFSDVLHSEKAVFAEALRRGVSTQGAHIYVSVFPCPDCAKLIAYSGIKKCFFGSGHASLDGERILKSQDVELVYVPFLKPRV